MWLFAALGTKWSTVAVKVVLSIMTCNQWFSILFKLRHCTIAYLILWNSFPFPPYRKALLWYQAKNLMKRKKELQTNIHHVSLLSLISPISKFKQKQRNTNMCLWNSSSTPPSPWDLKFSDSKKIAQTDLFYCEHRVLPEGKSHQRFKLCYFCPSVSALCPYATVHMRKGKHREMAEGRWMGHS